MNRRIFILLLFWVSICAPGVFAHEGHNKNAANVNANSAASSEQRKDANATAEPVQQPDSVADPNAGSHTAEFPTLHPLVVHFPIVLIILAAIIQLASLFVFRRELSWLVVFLAAFGAVGAYLSSNVFHPHTTGLSENAQRLLTEHELYADWTFWLAVAGLFAKGISNFFLDRKWWSEGVASVALILAAIAVALAGHHGAELVHKEGVGPQGKFLEMHDH